MSDSAAVLAQIAYRDATFEQLAAVDWGALPVDGDNHHHARMLAGRSRDFPEYYRPENRQVQRNVELWLNRYTDHHRYKEQNA